MTVVPEARSRERPGNIPGDLTSFVGRRREISQMRQILTSSRVVTLVGPGGVGKTRLALHVAASLQRRFFPDGAWWVDLVDLRDGSLLASKVAAAFGLRDQSARPASEVVFAHLERSELLLVLDNCEHLLAECARFVDTLVRACPGVRVVATSRQSLGVPGETALAVGPLPVPPLPSTPEELPTPEVLEQYASIRLFVDRAKQVLPEFKLEPRQSAALLRLCHRLDGIPLAIELAAVRLRGLSLEQIEERLGERYELLEADTRRGPPRHQALHALIGWSYDLCTRQEQLAWARTSTFSGSFDLAAAEHVVVNGDLRPENVLTVIDSLVNKSILAREEHDQAVRYRLLETIRQYGQEKLTALEENTAVARRHRDWYARLAERFAAEWLGPDQAGWVARLRREHANLRAALEFCVTEPGEAIVGLRMLAEIEEYWWMRGIDAEARYWITEALEAAPEPTPERAAALRVGGWFALFQGDFAGALPLLTESATLAHQLGVEREIAYSILTLGAKALFDGQPGEAVPRLDDAMRRFAAAGELRGELYAKFFLGLALGVNHEHDRAVEVLDEAITTCMGLGELCWRACAYWSLSQTELVAHNLDRAEEAGKEALRPQPEVDNKVGMAFALNTLAWIAESQGRHERAATLFGAADAMWQTIGASPLYAMYQAANDEYMSRARSALGDRRFDQGFAGGHEMPAEAAIDLALETQRPAAKTTTAPAEVSPLTKREREIAELVAQGLTNRDIAKRLFITQRTAEAHVQHILTKLEFTSRAQIAAWMSGGSRAD